VTIGDPAGRHFGQLDALVEALLDDLVLVAVALHLVSTTSVAGK
jgi:hypothetical protein